MCVCLLLQAHPGDVLSVRGLRMADGGSLIDQDDEVAEVLEDKEAVRASQHYHGNKQHF